MPEDSRTDDVEKFLTEQKSMEDRKQTLIANLLKEREAAMKAFDEKLAKLGYEDNSSGRTKRSHHRKTLGSPTPPAEEKRKPKA